MRALTFASRLRPPHAIDLAGHKSIKPAWETPLKTFRLSDHKLRTRHVRGIGEHDFDALGGGTIVPDGDVIDESGFVKMSNIDAGWSHSRDLHWLKARAGASVSIGRN